MTKKKKCRLPFQTTQDISTFFKVTNLKFVLNIKLIVTEREKAIG